MKTIEFKKIFQRAILPTFISVFIAASWSCDKAPKYLPGMDVSFYQEEIDWQKVADSGQIKFAYAKATQGTSIHDSQFPRNWQQMKKVGIHRGAYHFFNVDEDAKQQAEFFLQTLEKAGGLESMDLPPALDIECVKGGIDPDIPCYGDRDAEQIENEMLVWLQTVKEKTGRRPVIYTFNAYGDKILTDPAFGDYALWLGDTEPKVKKVPPSWEKEGWTFWQYAINQKVDGIAKPTVDLDRFKGGIVELELFIEESKF